MQIPVVNVGTLNITDKAKSYVNDVLNNNRLSYGPYSQRFENEFAKIHGAQFAILSNSGTSSLHVALATLKDIHNWEDGDEVIVPAVTFVATANIVLHNKMTPVFVDVESKYYELDPNLIEEKITKKTRAIIPVHLFGHPADMDPIREIAMKHDLKIIEDTCETMFARYNDKYVGNLGDIGCFSTYVAHLLTTGVGGFSTTNNPDYAIHMRSLVNHGRDSIYLSIDDDKDVTKEQLKMIVSRRFSFINLGHSFRITEMEAALGVEQLEHWQSMVEKRRSIARYYTKELSRFSDRIQLPEIRPGSEHSFMMYPIVLRDEPKTDLVNFLEENRIETRDMLPLTNQPVYHKILGTIENDYPIAKWINSNGFYIGSHQDIDEYEANHVIDVFERYFRGKKKPDLQKESSTLALIVNSEWDFSRSFYSNLPVEFFDKIRIFNIGKDCTDIREIGEELNADIINTSLNKFFEALKSTELQDPSENILIYKADGRSHIGEIGRLILHLEKGDDMVIASRFLVGGGRRIRNNSRPLRSFGNRFFTLLANLFFFGNSTDTLSSFRALKGKHLKLVSKKSTFLEALYELSITLIKTNKSISEIPTTEYTIKTSQEMRKAWLSSFLLIKSLLKQLLMNK
jgi:perosamine synthetase